MLEVDKEISGVEEVKAYILSSLWILYEPFGLNFEPFGLNPENNCDAQMHY